MMGGMWEIVSCGDKELPGQGAGNNGTVLYSYHMHTAHPIYVHVICMKHSLIYAGAETVDQLKEVF